MLERLAPTAWLVFDDDDNVAAASKDGLVDPALPLDGRVERRARRSLSMKVVIDQFSKIRCRNGVGRPRESAKWFARSGRGIGRALPDT